MDELCVARPPRVGSPRATQDTGGHTVATKTEFEAREGATAERDRETRGQGGNGGATRGQIRRDEDRFAELQERYQQQAQEQAEEVKRQLQQANEIGREALGQYVRAITRGSQAFLPQAVIDPGQAIDLVSDVLVQTVELQRSALHELVGVGQVSTRAFSRAADDLSENH